MVLTILVTSKVPFTSEKNLLEIAGEPALGNGWGAEFSRNALELKKKWFQTQSKNSKSVLMLAAKSFTTVFDSKISSYAAVRK